VTSVAARELLGELLVVMAKSKNHTNHNQNKKAHRNGIKKAAKPWKMSTKGMDPKFLRNQRYAARSRTMTQESKDRRREAETIRTQQIAAKRERASEQAKKDKERERQAAMVAAAKKKK